MILISVAIDINTKKKINNKGNKKMKHVIFAHSHCTDGLCAASLMKYEYYSNAHKTFPKNKNKEIDKKYGIIKQKRRNLWQ